MIDLRPPLVLVETSKAPTVSTATDHRCEHREPGFVGHNEKALTCCERRVRAEAEGKNRADEDDFEDTHAFEQAQRA